MLRAVPAVLNPRTQRHIEQHRNGTGHCSRQWISRARIGPSVSVSTCPARGRPVGVLGRPGVDHGVQHTQPCTGDRLGEQGLTGGEAAFAGADGVAVPGGVEEHRVVPVRAVPLQRQ